MRINSLIPWTTRECRAKSVEVLSRYASKLHVINAEQGFKSSLARNWSTKRDFARDMKQDLCEHSHRDRIGHERCVVKENKRQRRMQHLRTKIVTQWRNRTPISRAAARIQHSSDLPLD